MPDYCLDSNVFIQAKNGPYGMDIVPAFWDWLDSQSEAGVIFSTQLVYDELAAGDDELADWVKDRRTSGLFITTDEHVQQRFQDIANYIESHYDEVNARTFLAGADPWVVAHALIENAIVVTHETLVADNSRKVKIPNVCEAFQVDYINPYTMLRDLGARFIL